MYRPGDTIGPADIAIPIVDMDFHNSHRFIPDDVSSDNIDIDPAKTLPNDFFFAISQALWQPDHAGAIMETLDDSVAVGSDVMVSIPGVSMLA